MTLELHGPDQPRPPGWRAHAHRHSFTTPAPRGRVWAWLVDPATFTDTQVPPWRVEFLGGGFETGVLCNHHGPGLNLPGVLGEIREGEYRDLRYLYGAHAVSLRLLRPTRLQFWLADADADADAGAPGSTVVTLMPRLLPRSPCSPTGG